MKLGDDNFLVYAMHNYTVPVCPSIEEFENDLRLLIYIKKHLAREVPQARSLLNHVITFFNCFGSAALHMLFFKVPRQHWDRLGTVLIFLNHMPENLPEYEIRESDICIDEQLMKELRSL